MSTKNLSSVATQVIGAYGMTATNVINTYRYGGERVVGFIDERFATVVNRSGAALSQNLRTSLIDKLQRVSGIYVKGLHLGTDRAQSVVGVAVDLATKGVNVVASNARRLDRSANLNALDTLNRVAMPAATLINSVAAGIEEGSTELVKRVAGKRMPTKALATRKLNTAKRKAATARKQIVKTATEQVEKAVATRKKVTKVATKRVSQAVADTATQTSNAARRVARKAEAVVSAT